MISLWQRCFVSPLMPNCKVFLWCRPLLLESSLLWTRMWNISRGLPIIFMCLSILVQIFPKQQLGAENPQWNANQQSKVCHCCQVGQVLLMLYLSLDVLLGEWQLFTFFSGLWHSSTFEPWYWKIEINDHKIVFWVLIQEKADSSNSLSTLLYLILYWYSARC